MRNIIITGGGMVNKGAQAMTLIAVNELRRRFPDHEIYLYSPVDLENPDLDASVYRFRFTGWYPLKFARCQKNFLLRLATLLRSGVELKEAEAIYRSCDALVDISGYALGSNWSDKVCNDFLDILEFAQGFGIPVYLMPQSFGPFDFTPERQSIVRRIRQLLPGVKVIFAREQEGYDALVNGFGLKNVRLAKDLVLTGREIDPEKVFSAKPVLDIPRTVPGSVGLIPNSMNTKLSSEEAVLDIYAGAVEKLLELGKRIYILSHSAMDAQLCHKLKARFPEAEDVVLLDRELSCLEFNELVQRFDYLIASRFHSIVHAFKNGVPCIALGWATKYHDLLKLFGQGDYIFDVRTPQSAAGICDAIARMNDTFAAESAKIRAVLPAIEQENVFDIFGQEKENRA